MESNSIKIAVSVRPMDGGSMAMNFGKFCVSIDLGTTNTLVYSKKRGVVVNEASVIAFRSNEREKAGASVHNVGTIASALEGRTAPSIFVELPLAAGVISDGRLAKILLKTLTHGHLPQMYMPAFTGMAFGIVISAPREITEYERKAFEDAARSLGFSSVAVIDEPLAAALGAGLPVDRPQGQLLVDLGSGISEAVMISSGEVVEAASVRRGGNDLDLNIAHLLKNDFHF